MKTITVSTLSGLDNIILDDGHAKTTTPTAALSKILLTVAQAAIAAQVQKRTIRSLIESGWLRAVDYGDGTRRRYRLHPEDFSHVQPAMGDPVRPTFALPSIAPSASNDARPLATPQKLLSVRESAKLLGLSERTSWLSRIAER